MALTACLIFLGFRNTKLNLPLWFGGSMVLMCGLLALVMLCQWYTHREDKKRVSAAILIVGLYGVILFINRHDRHRFDQLTVIILILAGAIGIEYRRVLKLWVFTLVPVILVTFTSAILGSITNLIRYTDALRLKMRGSLGVIYPTDVASWIFFLLIIAWAAFEGLGDGVTIILSLLSLVITLGYCDSKCVLVCTLLFILVIIYRIFEKNVIEQNGKLNIIKKAVNLLALISVPLGAFTFMALTILYGKGSRKAYKINKLIHYRLGYSWEGLKECGLKLFGSEYQMDGDGNSYIRGVNKYTFLDCSYTNILIRFGIIAAILLLVIWTIILIRAIRVNDRRLVLVMGLIAVHSFEEHHFAEILYNPVTALLLCSFMAPSIEKKGEEPEKIRPGNRGPLLMGASVFIAAITAASPYLLALFRTVFDITDPIGSRKAAFIALIVTTLLLAFLGAVICGVIKAAAEQDGKVLFHIDTLPSLDPGILIKGGISGFLLLTAVSALFTGVSRGKYTDRVKSEKEAVAVITGAAEYPVYANDYPIIYLKAFKGISPSFWTDDDMARCKRGTVIFDKGHESEAAVKRGFMYAEISDYSGVYSNDREVINALSEAGYHVTGYYSSERELKIKDEDIESVNILPGKYVFRAVLETEGETDATLNLLQAYDGAPVATRTLTKEDFNSEGRADVEMVLNTTLGIRKLEYEIVPEGEGSPVLKALFYRRKPDFDTHRFYNDIYQVIREEYYDTEGNRITGSKGEAAAEYEYDDRRNRTVIRYYGLDYEPMIIKDGYAEIHRTYDDLARVTEVSYYDTDGSPKALKGGQAGDTRELDAAGNIIVQKYYDEEGKPVLLKEGYAEIHREFNDDKKVIREEYYDTEGKSVLLKSGYAAFEKDYDADGNETLAKYFGTDGKSVIIPSGYAEIHRKYNEFGYVTEESYYGTDGKLLEIKAGYAKVTRELDPLGRITRESFFGADGKGVMRTYGHSSEERDYDQNGNIIERRYFGTDGKPVYINDGYAAVESVYDDKSRLIYRRYLDTEGRGTAEKSSGIAEIHYEYGKNNKVISESYFGAAGEPAYNDRNISQIKTEYDEKGRAVYKHYYGTDGTPAAINSGYAGIKFEYNDKNQITGEWYYDKDGLQVTCTDGYYGIGYERDDKGAVTSQIFLDADGNRMNSKSHYAEKETDYDGEGRADRIRFLDVSGNKVNTGSKYAEAARSYDNKGRLIKEEYFDTEGAPVLNSNGTAAFERAYDESDLVTEEKYFDETGSLSENKSGISEIKKSYDSRNRLVKEEFQNTAGDYARKAGYAAKAYEYDDRSRCDLVKYVDDSGRSVTLKSGYSMVEYEYDEAGKKAVERYLDVSGNNVKIASGIAGIRRKYDGIYCIEESFIDIKGEPVNHSRAGYCTLKREYDSNRNLISVSYYDTAGKSVTNKDNGIARAEYEYDELRNRVKERHFDASGNGVK